MSRTAIRFLSMLVLFSKPSRNPASASSKFLISTSRILVFCSIDTMLSWNWIRRSGPLVELEWRLIMDEFGRIRQTNLFSNFCTTMFGLMSRREEASKVTVSYKCGDDVRKGGLKKSQRFGQSGGPGTAQNCLHFHTLGSLGPECRIHIQMFWTPNGVVALVAGEWRRRRPCLGQSAD